MTSPDEDARGPALVGLVPMAGRALRLGPLPGSKELIPVPLRGARGGKTRPRPVAEHLLGALARGGASRAYLLVGDGKWDIPARLGDGASLGLPLAYLPVAASPSVPYTLDQAYPFISGSLVALGFPDMLFDPPDLFQHLGSALRRSDADLALAVFPADRPEQTDVLELDRRGRIRKLVVKPHRSRLRLCWVGAVWGPRFTELLHAGVGSSSFGSAGREPQVSDVILAAIRAELHIETVRFPRGRYLDIGTPEGLARAMGFFGG